jgi:hypothetical protein
LHSDENEAELKTSSANFVVGKFSIDSNIQSRYFMFEKFSKTRVNTKVNLVFDLLAEAKTPLKEICVYATFYKINPRPLETDQKTTVSRYSPSVVETNITDNVGA